jgi:hypothetical protein
MFVTKSQNLFRSVSGLLLCLSHVGIAAAEFNEFPTERDALSARRLYVEISELRTRYLAVNKEVLSVAGNEKAILQAEAQKNSDLLSASSEYMECKRKQIEMTSGINELSADADDRAKMEYRRRLLESMHYCDGQKKAYDSLQASLPKFDKEASALRQNRLKALLSEAERVKNVLEQKSAERKELTKEWLSTELADNCKAGTSVFLCLLNQRLIMKWFVSPSSVMFRTLITIREIP